MGDALTETSFWVGGRSQQVTYTTTQPHYKAKCDETIGSIRDTMLILTKEMSTEFPGGHICRSEGLKG